MTPAASARVRRFATAVPSLRISTPYLPLAVLVGLALLVRALLMAGYPTTNLTFNDTIRFLRFPGYALSGDLFADPWMPAGYSAFLDALRFLTDWLPFTIAVQHLLGIASGMLGYLAAVRAGAPRWLALLPAAVVLFTADQLYLERTLLAETLFTFFIAAGLYATVRAADGAAGWAAAAGLLLACAALTRSVGLVLPAIAAAWLALVAHGGWRPRVRIAALAGAPAALLVAAYLATASLAGGLGGLNDMAGWNLYGRVAQFADCTRFDPPAGTEALCEATPPDERAGPFHYIWNPASHGRQVLGQRVEPDNGDGPGRFARAAVLGQPADYARTVFKDLLRFGDPWVGHDRPESGNTDLGFGWVESDYSRNIESFVERRYDGVSDRRTLVTAFETYDHVVTPGGLGLVLLVAAAAGGIAFGRGRTRIAALLFAVAALSLYVGSVATWTYDVRYGVPPLGPVAVAAALGTWALVQRWSPGRSRP